MRRSPWITPLLAATCLSLLSLAAAGCVPSLKGNDPREPNRRLPTGFVAPTQAVQAVEAVDPAAAAAQDVAQKTWTRLFGSPELRALIDGALQNNRELNIQLQEIIIAQNEVSARQGEVLPKVRAGAGVGVEKVGRDTSQGRADEATGVPEHLGNFTFGLSGSWEIDVWKKLRNAAKAAGYRYLASVEAKNFLVTQIVAEIARSYYELVALDNQLDILKKNLDIQVNALEVVKVEKEAARVTELAVQRFEAEVLKNQSRLYDVEQQRIRAENRINFLVGRYPQRVNRRPEELDAPLPDGIQAGLSTRLLENRPDVLAAILQRQPGVAEFVNNAWVQVISVDPETGEMLLFVPKKGFVPWVPAGGEVPKADSVPTTLSWHSYYQGHRSFLPPARLVGKSGGAR